MVIDLIVKAVNSNDVRESLDNLIFGVPFDDDRKFLEDSAYYEYLEFLYSRKFRKYWIYGKNIIIIYINTFK